MSYPDDGFDVVTGYAILHHLPVLESLREVFRVLRPGGRVLFFEPNLTNPELALCSTLPRSAGEPPANSLWCEPGSIHLGKSVASRRDGGRGGDGCPKLA